MAIGQLRLGTVVPGIAGKVRGTLAQAEAGARVGIDAGAGNGRGRVQQIPVGNMGLRIARETQAQRTGDGKG
jgi:hypothetical protein